ncbi:MAG: type II secretion system protein E [Gammaproteobacteria bacterium]|nr:MAG: type II secretion system protein E [Gammaproteobacteria bacterium]
MTPETTAVPAPAGAETAPQAGLRRPPYGFAKRHGLIVAGEEPDGRVRVLHRPDAAPAALLELRRFLGRPLALTPCEEDFNTLLARHYDRSGAGAQAMVEGMEDELDLYAVADALPEPEDLLESEDDAPIIRLLNALLAQAIKENASDIHIEPFESRLLVRMRVDGVLREVLEPPRSLAPLIISRIKVMAKLDIAEKRLPQDGRISLRVGGHPVDVRVSTLPSGHGERVVLRLLDKQAGRLDLEHLGMSPGTLARVKEVINKPHGIFLVTGPTGSGKTTTLYAALMQLNDMSRNILTVEDPIEYYLDGIGQTQVNNKVQMSFARGLRAILRQDPDVVMVGEIRDLETAEIAVQASLTGHLVFSTLHTNTAVGAVTRLRDMGVEPFLLSSTLLGVLSQRLVRLLCPQCKEPYTASETDCRIMDVDPSEPPTIYRARGCPACNQLGYVSRTGIHELVLVDRTMQQMIHDGAGEHQLEAHARTVTPSIRQDGVAKVLAGLTSLEEVLRVTKED